MPMNCTPPTTQAVIRASLKAKFPEAEGRAAIA